jgi:GNAT superfamily N-acetyltransferase
LDAGEIEAYMMEYDKRILHVRGNPDCVAELLGKSDLSAPLFNVESQHLPVVRERFEPMEPADRRTSGLITTFLTLKVTSKSLKPLIRHDVQELKETHVSDIAGLLEVEPQRAQDLLSGVGFGVFRSGRLVSCAVSPEMLEDLAIVRGVFTLAEERNKGYSSSVCSALVERLLGQGRDVILYVSEENPAAIKVYTRIGFKETGHVSLGFKAERKMATLE